MLWRLVPQSREICVFLCGMWRTRRQWNCRSKVTRIQRQLSYRSCWWNTFLYTTFLEDKTDMFEDEVLFNADGIAFFNLINAIRKRLWFLVPSTTISRVKRLKNTWYFEKKISWRIGTASCLQPSLFAMSRGAEKVGGCFTRSGMRSD